jgi:superfamily II helicase
MFKYKKLKKKQQLRLKWKHGRPLVYINKIPVFGNWIFSGIIRQSIRKGLKYRVERAFYQSLLNVKFEIKQLSNMDPRR